MGMEGCKRSPFKEFKECDWFKEFKEFEEFKEFDWFNGFKEFIGFDELFGFISIVDFVSFISTADFVSFPINCDGSSVRSAAYLARLSLWLRWYDANTSTNASSYYSSTLPPTLYEIVFHSILFEHVVRRVLQIVHQRLKRNLNHFVISEQLLAERVQPRSVAKQFLEILKNTETQKHEHSWLLSNHGILRLSGLRSLTEAVLCIWTIAKSLRTISGVSLMSTEWFTKKWREYFWLPRKERNGE